jgi:hypothetical protein
MTKRLARPSSLAKARADHREKRATTEELPTLHLRTWDWVLWPKHLDVPKMQEIHTKTLLLY